MHGILLSILMLFSVGSFANGQDAPASPFDDIMQQMRFDQPTRIVGRFQSIDAYEDAIWIAWTHRRSGAGWLPVQEGLMLKVLPRDAGMMEFFRALKPGTSVHMTIQQDQDGKRRILQLEET